jgi:hypothetical protein
MHPFCSLRLLTTVQPCIRSFVRPQNILLAAEADASPALTLDLSLPLSLQISTPTLVPGLRILTL